MLETYYSLKRAAKSQISYVSCFISQVFTTTGQVRAQVSLWSYRIWLTHFLHVTSVTEYQRYSCCKYSSWCFCIGHHKNNVIDYIVTAYHSAYPGIVKFVLRLTDVRDTQCSYPPRTVICAWNITANISYIYHSPAMTKGTSSTSVNQKDLLVQPDCLYFWRNVLASKFYCWISLIWAGPAHAKVYARLLLGSLKPILEATDKWLQLGWLPTHHTDFFIQQGIHMFILYVLFISFPIIRYIDSNWLP